jgi:RNA polymerase sigma-70 factor (ECF subfamily)
MGKAEPPADLRALLQTHHAHAWRWALFCSKDAQSAEDLLHEAYLKILDGRARFDGRSSFKTWLFGVIRFSWANMRRRRALLALIMEPIGMNAEAVATEAPISMGLSSQSIAALSKLPEKQRQVATLVFSHDLSVEEAAAVMGLSVGTARQHYARAKEKLRGALVKGASRD